MIYLEHATPLYACSNLFYRSAAGSDAFLQRRAESSFASAVVVGRSRAEKRHAVMSRLVAALFSSVNTE